MKLPPETPPKAYNMHMRAAPTEKAPAGDLPITFKPRVSTSMYVPMNSLVSSAIMPPRKPPKASFRTTSRRTSHLDDRSRGCPVRVYLRDPPVFDKAWRI